MQSSGRLEKDYQVRDALRTLLQASLQPKERTALFAALVEAGSLTAPLLPVLFTNVHNKPVELQQVAFELALRLERNGCDISSLAAELASHLTSAHPPLRQLAGDMLERMGPRAKPAEDFTLGCLRNKEREVALCGLRILRAIGSALSHSIGGRVMAVTDLFPGDEEIGRLARQVRSAIDAPSGSLRTLAREVRERLDGKRILLLDDNAPFRQLLTTLLEASGVIVKEENSGEQALKRLLPPSEDVYDLLLLEIRLPDINGLQVLSALRQNAVNIPAVVISGVNNEEIVLACGKLGAQQYVAKSTGLQVLLHILADVLSARS